MKSLPLNYLVIGEMASAGLAESSSKIPTRTVYETLRNSFSFLSVSNVRDSVAAGIVESKPRDPIDATPSKKENIEEQKIPGDKPKKKFGKKKEIVSSSTVVPRLEVCTGKKCKARGSEALLAEFQTASNGRVEIAHTKCMQECKQGMNTRVTKDGTTFEWNHQVTTTDVTPMLCKHFDW